MAEKQVIAEQAVAVDVVERAKGFWVANSKIIIIVGTAVILLLGGYLGYKYLVQIPNEKKANDLVFPAEKLFGLMAGSSSFNKDTVNMVLNGDKATGVTGLLKIASSYSGTKSGNRAEFMIGATYLQLKQYDKAIKHLKEFDGNGADQIQSKAYILLGHAYAEQKKTDDALDYYKKAGNISGLDEGMASEALFIAGRYAEALGKEKEAIVIFQNLKDKYPATQRVSSGEVDKYLASLGVVK
ncbi:MAG: tetratricopeptide repeat protein [Chitinophagaceae bacterium]|nr:tetratricopeptide repeat protein [Chitinophagaceae bacterium]